MRIFFLFSPTFDDWPLAIARELSRRNPATEFMGLVAGKRRIYKKVLDHTHPAIRPVYDLAELEKGWLRTPVAEDAIPKYVKLLGDNVLNRIVASSRQLGYGWVSGAVMAKTELMRRSQDSDNVRRYVVGLLDFLFEMFHRDRPDLVFCYAVAGEVSYGLGKVCQHLGVPFRQLVHTRIGAKCILDDTPEGLLEPICRTYGRALKNPVEVEPYLPQAREHLQTFRMRPLQPEYNKTVTKQVERKKTLLALPGRMGGVLLAALKTMARGSQREWHEPSDWARSMARFRITLRSLKLKFKSPFREIGDFPRRSFAFFPLHYDPEASTMVLSPLQANQPGVIEALAKSLPFGMDLVLKEHQTMVGLRPAGFYETLQKMPKVILASPSESPFKLIQRADLICTITGTTAWEAIQLGKPVVVIGEMFPFLCLGQGMVHCPDFPGLPGAIARALNEPPASTESLELFIASVLSQAFDFPATLYWEKISREKIEAQVGVLKHFCDRLEAATNVQSC